jgi:hypothetical protein
MPEVDPLPGEQVELPVDDMDDVRGLSGSTLAAALGAAGAGGPFLGGLPPCPLWCAACGACCCGIPMPNAGRTFCLFFFFFFLSSCNVCM